MSGDVKAVRDAFTQLMYFGYTPNKILDIGANHGKWSKMMQEFFPNASLFLLEAIDYEELRNSGFNYHIAILADKITEVDWY